MAAYSSTFNGNIIDSATFQTFVQKVEAALLASGLLVVAADTGQIDPTSVALPSIGSYAGFRIYRFADATPGQVYMKVEYGVGAAAGRPQIRCAYSTSTNGAGTQTGFVSNVQTVGSGNVAGTASDLALGGGGVYGGICMIRIGATGPYLLGMSRLVKDDGTISTQGAFGLQSNTSGNIAACRTDFNSAWTSLTQIDGMSPNPASALTTAGAASKIGLTRSFVTLAGEILELPILAGRHAEVSLASPASAFAATWRGASHTFIPVSIPTYGPLIHGATPYSSGCMLFE